jgi:hypothetical protein
MRATRDNHVRVSTRMSGQKELTIEVKLAVSSSSCAALRFFARVPHLTVRCLKMLPVETLWDKWLPSP